ncbi:hypothetical protein GCM10011575_05060 [Microlunatus endophyticus]|uniref:DUF3866 domain-containing protein n=1 Tax=Microlunatus endophyticus TaxID=1716077 RepID=A0A917S116_9ACTN|nr:DUF3866 family protein [Microlunatus endophyticus]GGL49863.1 hypothetical protein GCM10011575_05060 [Microlunatus endophyticus]
MIIWAEGTVAAIGDRWTGAAELIIDTPGGQSFRSLVYLQLMPLPRIGDRVLINIAAVARGLGTGGYALVVAVLDDQSRLIGQPDLPKGHLVKARYTPTQVMIAGVDEQGSEFHDQLDATDDLDGLPVIVADLHSAVVPIIAAIRADARDLRVGYLMTDEAALPIAFSRTVSALKDHGWLAGTITCGQAYGGDLEAVNVHSGLLAAKVALGADLVIVSQGPGNLGTGTHWGFSGTGAGDVINAASVLNGRPIGTLRISSADPRFRHRDVSHHSLTAYGKVALRTADIAVPDFSDVSALAGIRDLYTLPRLADRVFESVAALTPLHRLHRIGLGGLDRALLESPISLSTMGRDLDADPAYFLAAAAAGRLAVEILGS